MAFSSPDKNLVVCGKSGRTKRAIVATNIVTAASIMKSHLHEAMPLAPSSPCWTPAPTRPPNPPDRSEPAYSIEVRSASSLRVYHDESKNSAPGKYGLDSFS